MEVTMADEKHFGLSRRELEEQLRWLLVKPLPKEPDKLIEALGHVFIMLMTKNNEALAKCVADRERTDMPGHA
jgi:hypothetical protein